MLEDFKKYNNVFLIILITALIGGATPVFVKIALREIPPFTFTFLRFFIASILILPFFLRLKPKINSKAIGMLILSLLATINVTLFAFGVKLTTASISQLLYMAVPIFAGILSYVFLKEKITTKKIIGILIGFLGTLIVILLPLFGNSSPFAGDLTGNFLIIVAVISFSIYTVFSKKAQNEYSPMYLTALFIFITALVLSVFAVSDYAANPNWWRFISNETIFATLYVGSIGTFGFYLLFQYAIKHSTPTVASTTGYIQTIATFMWAFILLGEQLTPYFALGSALAFLGAWLTSQTKHNDLKIKFSKKKIDF